MPNNQSRPQQELCVGMLTVVFIAAAYSDWACISYDSWTHASVARQPCARGMPGSRS